MVEDKFFSERLSVAPLRVQPLLLTSRTDMTLLRYFPAESDH